MIFEESYTLHNGAAIPKLALGTWFIDDDKAAEAVQAAVILLKHWLKIYAVLLKSPTEVALLWLLVVATERTIHYARL